MGRGKGYRPTKATRKHVHFWRRELAKLRSDEWIKAGMIMQEIVRILGIEMGPGNGRIEPRVCSYCDYFGHTKLWCKKREADLADAEAHATKIVRRENDALERAVAAMQRRSEAIDTYLRDQCGGRHPQAAFFEDNGIPYRVDPDLGPILA